MQSTPIRLGGVPEHFNLPIHLALERGNFIRRGVDVSWTTFSGGTGQMTRALRENEVDACILLTEGIVTDIIKGNPSKIVSLYVNTPLTWGIHTGAQNELRHYEDIYDKTFAISRFGSGSHLMPIVDANSKDKEIRKDQFKIIKNLDGALASLTAGSSDVFYWEKYTTKPYVDSGQLRRIGEYVTPWPCFAIAVREEFLNEEPETVIRMLRTIHDSCDLFMHDEESITLVSNRYDQKLKDVERWFHSTEWAIHGWVSDKMIKSVLYNLKAAEIVDTNASADDLIWKR